jgi:hypothetical protein
MKGYTVRTADGWRTKSVGVTKTASCVPHAAKKYYTGTKIRISYGTPFVFNKTKRDVLAFSVEKYIILEIYL